MWLWLLGLVFMTALMLGWRSLLPSAVGHAHVRRQNGAAVLRPPRGRNAMLAGLALAPTLVLVAALARLGRGEAPSQSGLALAFTLVGLGGFIVVWLLAAEFRQSLRVDATSLDRVFAVTHLKVSWSEVERITWNPTSRWFFLVAAGAWLWVPVEFDGISDFAQLALASLPPPVLQSSVGARRALEELAMEPEAPPPPA
jgi:hypothetical protein